MRKLMLVINFFMFQFPTLPLKTKKVIKFVCLHKYDVNFIFVRFSSLSVCRTFHIFLLVSKELN